MIQVNNKARSIKETNQFLALLWAVIDQIVSGKQCLRTPLTLNNAVQLRVLFSELN